MEPLIVIAALVGVVWGAVIFLRGGLLAGALTVLLAGTVSASPRCTSRPEPMPLTSDRILWVLLMVQLVFWWRIGSDCVASHRSKRTAPVGLYRRSRGKRSDA